MGVWGCGEGRGGEIDGSLEICTYISFTLLLPELILVHCINCGCWGREGKGGCSLLLHEKEKTKILC